MYLVYMIVTVQRIRAGSQHVIDMCRFFLSIMCVILLGVQSSFASREFRYHTVIVDVVDGNNVIVSNRVFNSGYELKINNVVPLDGIDAPSLEEKDGGEACDALVEWVRGRQVNICELIDSGVSKGVSVYVTDVPRKFEDSDNVNLRLLRNGLAKWNGKMMTTSVSIEKMIKAQRVAQKKGLGIWKNEKPETSSRDIPTTNKVLLHVPSTSDEKVGEEEDVFQKGQTTACVRTILKNRFVRPLATLIVVVMGGGLLWMGRKR